MSDKTVIGLSRLIALQQRVNNIAHNIANQSTDGFKSDAVRFEVYLSEAKEGETPSLSKRSLVQTRGYTDFSNGPIKLTGRATDVALIDDSFLVVQTANGERYTRKGSLHVDASGRLVTNLGASILTSNGALVIDPSEGPISIGADGTISSANRVLGRLRLVKFENLRLLSGDGAGLYRSSAQPIEVPGGSVRVVAGALEGANVKTAHEMINLVDASRAYAETASVIMKNEDNGELKKLSAQDL